MKLEFFLPIEHVPTVTAQEHKIVIINGKPNFYDPPELKSARSLLTDYLALHRPQQPIDGPLELVATWCFKSSQKLNGKYKITKPDTDNLDKLLKDCMTDLGFWTDDAQVCREIIEKFWSVQPGIYIRITQLEE